MKKVIKSRFMLLLSVVVLVGLLLSPVTGAESAERSDKPIYSFADIAEEVDSGVVKITSEVEVEDQQMSPFMQDPFFKYFFGDQLPSPEEEPDSRKQQGYGTGIVVSEDGYIVTNEHVVRDADKVEVTIKDQEDPIEAEVLWSDFSLDLAILDVDVDEDLNALKLGDSDNIRPGDRVVAIGNPFGFEHTVTTGVISALGRPIKVPTEDGQIRSYRNLIQTDAAINPGNSGGPLLNLNGEVIGINTAVSRQGQGIGFAIPINEVKDIVDELKEEGEITRPWLGISFGPVTEDVRDYFNLEDTEGVIVTKVFEDSPAEEAGLQPYDIIREIDKKSVESVDDVVSIVQDKEVGEKIMINVVRDGSSQIIVARVGERPNKM